MAKKTQHRPAPKPAAKTSALLAHAQSSVSKVDASINGVRQGDATYHANFPIEKIQLYPSQVRDREQLSTDESTLDEMESSITEVGLISPILLRKDGNNHYLVAGERRFRSVKNKGGKTIAALVRVMSDEECERIQIHENIHRANLTQADMARALKKAQDRGEPIDAILAKWGKTRQWASKIKIFIDETPVVQRAIKEAVTSDRQVLAVVKQVAKTSPEEAEALVDELSKDSSNHRTKAENVLAKVKARAGKQQITPKRFLEIMFEQLQKGEPATDLALSYEGEKSPALAELEQIYSDARTQGAAGLMASLKSKEFAAEGAGAIRLAAYLSGMTEPKDKKFTLLKALLLVKP